MVNTIYYSFFPVILANSVMKVQVDSNIEQVDGVPERSMVISERSTASWLGS